MNIDQFSSGTRIRFVRERVGGLTVVVDAVVIWTSGRCIGMAIADGRRCTMVLGADCVVPGILLWFRDGHDMDDDDPIEVTDVVGNTIEVPTREGERRYILVGQEHPTLSIAGARTPEGA